MIVYLFVLIVVCLIGCELKDNGGYLDKNQTTAIKGIFAIIVFLSHCRGYINNCADDKTYYIFDYFISWIGQLMVAPFLFYSGFGILESVKRKDGYIRKLPRNRIIPIIVHLAFVLVIYIIMNMLLGISYPIKNYILCWVGWESIGNSNWYVFDILLLYLLTWAVFRLAERTTLRNKIVLLTIVTMVMVILLRVLHKEDWWYNTIMCYPMGMLISYKKENINTIIGKKSWFITFAVLALFFIVHSVGSALFFILSACLFCIVILLVSRNVKVGNMVLIWIGNHLFEIYILQRIPMMVLAEITTLPAWLFTFITWALVCALAYVFDILFLFIDKTLKKEYSAF